MSFGQFIRGLSLTKITDEIFMISGRGKWRGKNIPVYKEKAINIYQQNMRNEHIILSHPQQVCSIVKSTLEDCIIELKNPAMGICLSNSYFIRCRIIAKRVQNDHQFSDVGFEDCIFEGKYRGCEFGCKFVYPGFSVHGYIKNCNFSGASMDFCSFHDTSLEDLVLPAWPHVAVIKPHTNSRKIKLMSDLKVFQDMFEFFSSEYCDDDTLVIDVSERGYFSRKYKGRIDMNELKAIIPLYPDVFYVNDH